MDLITHIRTFSAVVRCGGFSEAARKLGLVPSVVAKRIAQLEQELKTRLFDRTTRKVSLTEAGEKLYARAEGVVATFEELVQTVERDDGKLEGHLRVMAPTTLVMKQLGPVFCAFLLEHPRITLEIALVDHSANPIERGFDMAISGRLASYEGVVDLPLCPVQPLLCAAPAYLLTHVPPTHPRELAEHACLVFSATGTVWNFQGPKGVVSVEVRPRLLADDNLTLLHGTIAGLGIASLPAYVAVDALAAGALQIVMPNFSPQDNWFKAYVPHRRRKIARVKALLAWLNEHWARKVTQVRFTDPASMS